MGCFLVILWSMVLSLASNGQYFFLAYLRFGKKSFWLLPFDPDSYSEAGYPQIQVRNKIFRSWSYTAPNCACQQSSLKIEGLRTLGCRWKPSRYKNKFCDFSTIWFLSVRFVSWKDGYKNSKRGFKKKFFFYFIQHCFTCRSSDSSVSKDAGFELRTVTTLTLAVRRHNHSVRF